MMTTWQCSGCKKVWSAEEPPAECACGCRIVREVSVAPVEAKPAAAPEPAPAAPAVPSGPQPFWRRARVQGIAAACACLALAAAGWCGYAWHSAHERRRAETETYVYSSYQPSLDKAKALKAASPDRGEGFGPHLDALSAACSGAETAWGAKNQELCRTFLEKAQAELRWLDDAVPGRAKVAALRLQVDGDRSTAEREKAGEFAAAEWAAAGAAYAKADGLREKGEFASALAAYGEAGAGCRKAAASARAAHAAAAAAKFEGLIGPLAAKFELLEKDACQTGLVAAAAQDVSALERLAAEERGYLPEADGKRLAESNGRLGRYRARAAFGMSLAEIEAELAALAQGRGAGQSALMESVRGRIDGALRDAGGVREDQKEPDLKRLADAEGRLKGLEAAARAARVAEFLAKAAGAKRNSDWRGVRENAEAALALDADNAEAQAFKQEARDALTPTLRVTATVDGQEVAATLSDGASTCTTPASLTLERGKSYEYAVTYRSPSGTRYHVADKLKVTANWKGISSRQVVLEPALITPATFEQALKESAAGDVLELGEGEFCFHKITVSRDLTLRGRGVGKTVIRVEFRFTIEASSVAIENCSVESKGDNAIQVAGVGGKVLLSNCTCKTLSNDTGGYAVWLGDGCSGSIRNCELNGVRISDRCVCEIADSRVIGANDWGVDCSTDSSLRMTSTVVANCKNHGIVLFERAKCELNDCKFTGNKEGCHLNADSAVAVANRCTISENENDGFWVAGHLKLNNCSISGNGGSGIYMLTSEDTCEYFNCTFYGNKLGDIHNPGRATKRYSPIQ